jgi:hypothetical protein
MRIGVPVRAERHAAIRTSCPPPSPVRPSSTTIFLLGISSIVKTVLKPLDDMNSGCMSYTQDLVKEIRKSSTASEDALVIYVHREAAKKGRL